MNNRMNNVMKDKVNDAESFRAILTLLGNYFEGLYQADSALLATLFHPKAQYVNTVSDDYRVLTLAEYKTVLDQRVAPASTGEQRNERIVSIEIGDKNLAFVRAEMTMMGRLYTDFLTLIFYEEQWLIISKVFHYAPNDKHIANKGN